MCTRHGKPAGYRRVARDELYKIFISGFSSLLSLKVQTPHLLQLSIRRTYTSSAVYFFIANSYINSWKNPFLHSGNNTKYWELIALRGNLNFYLSAISAYFTPIITFQKCQLERWIDPTSILMFIFSLK